MKITLCIISAVVACLHAYAAAVQIKRKENKGNAQLMIAGAVMAMIAIVLCLANRGSDWLLALAGFSLIALAAVRNGMSKQNVHIRHHIVRIGISIALIAGFCLL